MTHKKRTEYNEFFAKLAPERQEVHLTILLAWALDRFAQAGRDVLLTRLRTEVDVDVTATDTPMLTDNNAEVQS